MSAGAGGSSAGSGNPAGFESLGSAAVAAAAVVVVVAFANGHKLLEMGLGQKVCTVELGPGREQRQVYTELQAELRGQLAPHQILQGAPTVSVA